jgi:hypothetical protein
MGGRHAEGRAVRAEPLRDEPEQAGADLLVDRGQQHHQRRHPGTSLAFDRHGFFGCPFISAAVEAPLDSPARAVTLAHTRRRQAWIAGLCAAAGVPDPARLAGHLGLLIDGALARGRLEQDRAVVEDAKQAARAAITGN